MKQEKQNKITWRCAAIGTMVTAVALKAAEMVEILPSGMSEVLMALTLPDVMRISSGPVAEKVIIALEQGEKLGRMS